MRHSLPIVALTALFAACGADPGSGTVAVLDQPGAVKTAAVERAKRRLFDGAPPVIAHRDFGADCLSCHRHGMSVPGVGYAPTVPHDNVDTPGGMSRCNQCHVWQTTTTEFVANDFLGLQQDLRRGQRLNDFAPPVIPHQLLLRENCTACHTGPAAREEIRCPHPERQRCTQCHVEKKVAAEFAR